MVIDGTDKILFHIEAPSPFPNMGHEPYFTIETQAGYAEAWLESIKLTISGLLSAEYELINIR